MKKWFITTILGCIIAFSGCSVNQTEARECVTDVWVENALPAFSLDADLPPEAILTAENDCGQLYAHGDYEIITEVFPAASVEEGITYLTGRESAPVLSLLVSEYPREEYRFSWTAAGEKGTVACNCAMFFDGSYCYSLQIQCPLEKERDYRSSFYEILASARLI